MQKNIGSQTVTILAIQTSTNLPVTGEAGNITLYYNGDNGGVTVFSTGSGHPSEDDATNSPGTYTIAMTQGETNFNNINISGKCSTSGVRIVPILNIQTVPAAFTIAGGASGGFTIAGSNAATTFSGLTTGALACTTITASGAVAFQSTFAVTTSTALAALSCTTLTASGAVAFQSTFAVTTSTSLAALSCTTLTASGAVAFQSTFAVTSTTTLTGNVSLGGTLGVTGTTTFAAINTGAIGTGNVTITGTLSTSGTTTLNALTVTNATTLSGAVSLGSTLGVTGTTTLNVLTVTNATTLSGAVSLGSTLGVAGTVTFNAFTVTNAFTVSGATTLTGIVTASNASNNIVGVHLATTQTFDNTGTWTGNIVGNLTGSVGGDVVGDVGGDVLGTVDSIVDPGNVWDVTLASHVTAGSTGQALSAAGAAGDPWITSLPGIYIAGQAGYILGTYLDAAISSLPTAADMATAVWRDTTSGDFTVSGSIGKSLFTGGVIPGAAGGLFIAGTNAATTVNITGNITGNLSGSVGSVTTVTNIVSAGAITTSGGAVSTVTTLSNLPSIPANWLTATGIDATGAEYLADVALVRDWTATTGAEGEPASRSSMNALRKLRNHIDTTSSPGNLVVTRENDITTAYSQAIIVSASAELMTSVG